MRIAELARRAGVAASAVRWYEQAGVRAFATREDADLIAPFQFDVSPAFEQIWRA